MDNFKNLETGRYKACGYGRPLYNHEGEYDEVVCELDRMEFCGEIDCPLDEGVNNAKGY